MAPDPGDDVLRRAPWRMPALLGAAIGLCLVCGAADWWLWHARHAYSTELLFVQARANLALQPSPPNGVLLSTPPVVLYVTMLFGSAPWAAAVCGTIATLMLLVVVAPRGQRWLWFLPLALQPIVVFGVGAFPSRLLACACLAVVVTGLADYIRQPRLNPLTNAALALAALVLIDWDLWPLWFIVVAGIVVAVRTPWPERVTLCLVAVFPALAVSLIWLYLNLTDTGWSWFFRDMPHLSLGRIEGWQLDPEPIPSGDAVFAAASAAAPVIVAMAVAALSGCVWGDPTRLPAAGTDRWRARVGTMAIVSAPVLLLLLRASHGQAVSALDATMFTVAAAVALVAGTTRPAARAAGWALLVVLAAAGWHAVLSDGGEPVALVQAGLHGGPTPALAPAARMAARVTGRRGSADRLLVDDQGLFPVVALLEDDAWIPSSSWDFHLASTRPAPRARFILQPEATDRLARRSPLHVREDELARDYVLTASDGPLRLYERRADWSVGRSRQ